MKCERLSWSGVWTFAMRGVRSSVFVVGDILRVNLERDVVETVVVVVS